MHDNNDNGMIETDGEKLRLLADWFDKRYPDDPTPDVQNDLRRMADRLDDIENKDLTMPERGNDGRHN